jgi:hypothetical protein
MEGLFPVRIRYVEFSFPVLVQLFIGLTWMPSFCNQPLSWSLGAADFTYFPAVL